MSSLVQSRVSSFFQSKLSSLTQLGLLFQYKLSYEVGCLPFLS